MAKHQDVRGPGYTGGKQQSTKSWAYGSQRTGKAKAGRLGSPKGYQTPNDSGKGR